MHPGAEQRYPKVGHKCVACYSVCTCWVLKMLVSLSDWEESVEEHNLTCPWAEYKLVDVTGKTWVLGGEFFLEQKTGQPFTTHVKIYFIGILGSTGSFRKKKMLNIWLSWFFPRFLLQLVSSAPALDHTPVSLNVVETNPFKHLTHLSLKFLPGTDAEIKKFLANCLKCLKVKWKFIRIATNAYVLKHFFHSE